MSTESTVAEKQIVLFQLGKETYGVDITAVHEIIRMQPITRLPNAPLFVEGVINLRGRVIPVVDMGKRFGMEKAEEHKNNRIVVLDIKGTTLGIIVDEVKEVLRISPASVETASNFVTGDEADYLQGIAKLGERMVMLLDLDQALGTGIP